MAKRLQKRISTESAPSKKVKETPEPDTYLCEGAKPVAVDKSYALGLCKKCKVMPAHSESDSLCYDCHKEAAGFEYDGKLNRYIKIKGRK
jgi:hypothetical protein